jgi:hypothetical protein
MNGRSGLWRAGWLLVCGAGVLSAGCVSSPTYGTGVSANRQLATDVSNILSLGPKPRPVINYKPRPELVKPNQETASEAALPAPQQALASTDNPQWPESPEERRRRIRASATANQNNPFYEPEVASDAGIEKVQPTGPQASWRAQESGIVPVSERARGREQFNKRLAERNQGDPTQRKYLSEPPLAYREPAATAPQNDVGEDEWKKEKRLKAEARKNAGKKGGWFDWLPGV